MVTIKVYCFFFFLGKMISTKWTNIRDRYIKYLKKLEDEKKTGSKAKSIRKYIYSDNMSFLQKNTKRKETVSSAVEEEEHEEISRDIPTLSDPQPSTSTQGKGKRQKTLVTDIEKSILKKNYRSQRIVMLVFLKVFYPHCRSLMTLRH